MNKEEIRAFITQNPFFCLATVEDGKPRVRTIMLFRVEEDGILFHTGKNKDLYRQLLDHPEVELCFFTSNKPFQVRVTGIAELVDDLELKKEIVENREFLRPWVESEGYDPLAPFRVRDCIATVWTMDLNFAPKKYVRL